MVKQTVQNKLSDDKGIVEVRIFGSRAKGNYSARSDIDLALTGYTAIPFNELMDINVQIDDLALLYKVDIIDYAKVANEPIGKHIDRVGKLFYKRGQIPDTER